MSRTIEGIMDPALLTLIGVLFGGVAVKVVDKLLNRGKEKADEATTMRNELRADLGRYREELKAESQDADKWQSAYWELKAELLIQNHKANKVIEVVDNKHPEAHLGEELEGLEYPGK